PDGCRYLETPLPSCHFMTTLLGMSEKSKKPPSLTQTGPSVQMKPRAMVSTLASLGSSLSKRGSSRTILRGGIGSPPFSLSPPSAAGNSRATPSTRAHSRNQFMPVPFLGRAFLTPASPTRVALECTAPKRRLQRLFRRRLSPLSLGGEGRKTAARLVF